MLKHNLHKVLLVFLSCFLILVLAAPVHAAAPAKIENGMLTTPPPAEDFVTRYVPTPSAGSGDISIESVWDPNHLYLSSGDAQIGISGTGNILLSGSTTATQIVQQIGLGLSLQRWTGSYWVDVYFSTDRVLTNTASVIKSDESAGTIGYYYRTVARHWVDHNSVHEEGTTYGSAMAYY